MAWRFSSGALLFATLIGLLSNFTFAAEGPAVKLQKGDHVILVGNTLAERMQYFGNFETLLHSRFPDLNLYVRDLGWSADEITLRPRSKDFRDHGHTLQDHKPNVLLAFFGFNESFAGPAGIAKFEADLEAFLQKPQMIDQFSSARSDWDRTPDKNPELAKLESLRQVVLCSPIAQESKPGFPDAKKNNENLKLYTEAMVRIAKKHNVAFIDLFTPSAKAMSGSEKKLTINGVHLNEAGDKVVGEILDEALFGARPATKGDLGKLLAEVNEKNLQFFYDYRAVNGFYIYGGRKNPFGVVNFPAEFAKLRKMTALRDERIWAVARGEQPVDAIDDSKAGELVEIKTNKDKINLTTPQQSLEKIKVLDGMAVNLFASEVEFPELEKPVQFSFDNRGRLWVLCMPSYPGYLPGVPANDRIVILEDTNADGKADKSTVFADKLHVPTGMELLDGGVYVATQPNVTFLQDTDGDDKADVRRIVLHGFDSADSHHSISAFTVDQAGALYFEEGTFHHTQVETPHGPVRCVNAGVYRWEPRSNKLDVFVSYGFANPWGHCIDRWGQNFIADASGGANYWGAAFSGDVDYPRKHGGLKQFLTKQYRPTAGCEFVSSRNFPDELQGNYLLNNCIGFQGVANYKVTDEGADAKAPKSGFSAAPVDVLLQSSDENFRPVDLEFGPDGALYLCDWFNPLVGHMQHSIRDPNRDHKHGRIYRVHNTKKPLVKSVKIAGEPIPVLLDLFKTQPEERTRQHVRVELRNRDTKEVLAAAGKWLAAQNKDDAEFEHHRLEVLWLHQSHDVVNEALLKEVLGSNDYRARSAGVRVLCYQRDRVTEPLKLLQTAVNDAHPRVRLEAVRALSFYRTQEAIDIATESLIHPQDEYLKYVYDETMKTLEPRVKAAMKK